MKKKILILFILSFIILSCVSIPKETVDLSKTIGNDLEILYNAHHELITQKFEIMKADINAFVDDKYAPFIVHYVLKNQLEQSKKGESTLYSIIEAAGKTGGKEETEEAVQVMVEFQQASYFQIEAKRKELLTPIIEQELEVLKMINTSYKNIIYANSTITGHLESIRKVKETQKEALKLVGLKGSDEKVSNILLKLSKGLNEAIKIGKDIDIKSDDAYEQLKNVSNRIKNLNTKN